MDHYLQAVHAQPNTSRHLLQPGASAPADGEVGRPEVQGQRGDANSDAVFLSLPMG